MPSDLARGKDTLLERLNDVPHLHMVAALSAAHLGALVLPRGLRRLYVVCDNDRAGLDAGLMLGSRAISQGVAARLLVPSAKDFNDDLITFGRTSLWRRIGPHLWREDRSL